MTVELGGPAGKSAGQPGTRVIVPENRVSVDRLEVVAPQVESHSAKRRGRKTERRYIEGTDELWQVGPDGGVYYKRQRIEPTGQKVPMIDLGCCARAVPVLRAYDDGTDMWFVDDLVSWHFVHRTPINLQRFTHTVHRDGDWSNCAADNVFPMIDPEWWGENESLKWVELWAAEQAPAKLTKTADAARFGGLRGEVKPRDLRDCDGTIATLPKWAAVKPAWVQDRFKDMEKSCA